MEKYINLLKISILKNKKGFIINKNTKNINITKALIKLNIIKFTEFKKNLIIIYINYNNNKPVFKNIINIFKTSSYNYISIKELKKINEKHNWIFLLSTNKGILNSKDAIKLNVGGLLLAKIWN